MAVPPPEAYAAALAGLPGMTSARLAELLQAPPRVAWQMVLDGDVRRRTPRGAMRAAEPDDKGGPDWFRVAGRTDVAQAWAALRAAGIGVVYRGGEGMPEALASDPEPPGVVYYLGDLGVLSRPCVAIVGTRHCSGYGRRVARALGHDLAAGGVCVVSGLAFGVDGEAHRGAVVACLTASVGSGRAGPLGVVASGLEFPSPQTHSELWRQVAGAGAIISETPPGQLALPWRFPLRNRVIAAVAKAVVVVESPFGGGSMLTVAAAAERGVEVLAVPGRVTNAASDGTNQLIYEGAKPVRHADDVPAAIGIDHPRPVGDWSPAPPDRGAATRAKTGRRSPRTRSSPVPRDAGSQRAGEVPDDRRVPAPDEASQPGPLSSPTSARCWTPWTSPPPKPGSSPPELDSPSGPSAPSWSGWRRRAWPAAGRCGGSDARRDPGDQIRRDIVSSWGLPASSRGPPGAHRSVSFIGGFGRRCAPE